jgi:NitT/TauT family transport system substrate-binding protein
MDCCGKLRASMASLLLTVLALVTAAPAMAQTAVRLGVTPIGDYIAAWVGKDQGIFAKHGLNVTIQTVPISPMAAAALMSGSLDFATPTAPDLLQAADSGIDLVAIASVSVMAKQTGTQAAVVVQPTFTDTRAQSLVGKKIGVASLNGLLHILFRDYLMDQGVDPAKVNYVEIGVPSHFDAMRGGSVDGVVTADPLLTRILEAKAGRHVVYFGDSVPPRTVTGLIATTRRFADANPRTVEAFRAAWAEATAFTAANHEVARAAIVQHLKFPPPAAASLSMPLSLTSDIDVGQIEWWEKVMRRQNMLRGPIDAKKLLLR